eukprot:TRINITY_DN43925_c0_g1_i1.p1 TRINITY_DN43925_c0_g1~~TRINITY_DN43925_c0_g1_i1.p1  ORF type:complete len:232 (-),score=27.38 TRINITY_DN43925_c0_g1_i1:16-711(-)
MNQYKKDISDGIPKNRLEFKSRVHHPDCFQPQIYLQDENYQLPVVNKIVDAKTNQIVKNFYRTFSKSSNSVQPQQTKQQLISPQIIQENPKFQSLMQQKVWKHPTFTGYLFTKSIQTYDEKSKEVQLENQKWFAKANLKDTALNILREKRLENNGQLGWGYLRKGYDTFTNYPTKSYALSVKHAEQKLVPFIPPCFTTKLFDNNVYAENKQLVNRVEFVQNSCEESLQNAK